MNCIKRAFELKKMNNWPKLFIAIDLHRTIITPTWSKFNEGAELYPYCATVLTNWSLRDDICLILWTSSHQDAIGDILGRLKTWGIKFDYVNEQPETPSSDLCDFSRKFYFDLVFDDKGCFDAETDWKKIYDTLKQIGEWDLTEQEKLVS